MVEHGELGRSRQALREVVGAFQAGTRKGASLVTARLSAKATVIVMMRLASAALVFVLMATISLRAQDLINGVDLLYPELAHPTEDAEKAIKQRDFRFVTVDRYGRDAPGVERYPGLKKKYRTKVVRQHLRLIVSRSQKFSFRIRARAYAEQYNRLLLRYLQKEKP